MEPGHSSASSRTVGLILALLTWATLVLQCWLMLTAETTNGFSKAGLLTNFFSYFTILSNLLVALTLILPAGSRLSTPAAQSAIAVYIFIVGLVYNLVLRQVWSPQGWQLVADNLLHVAVPVLYVAWWYYFIPAKAVHWKNLPAWLLFPAVYLAYSLVRGAQVDWYPYPFLDVQQFGYSKVAINAAGVLLAFLAVGFLLIALNRNKKR